MKANEAAPLGRKLIVDENLWLRKERDEALLETKFRRSVEGVCRPTGAPAVQLGAKLVEFARAFDGAANRNAFGSEGPDERVVDVDKADGWPHAAGRRTLLCKPQASRIQEAAVFRGKRLGNDPFEGGFEVPDRVLLARFERLYCRG